MNVLLITSRGACGISDHSDQLIAAVQTADPEIQIVPSAEELDGDSYAVKALIHDERHYDLVVLNFHEAIYRNWPLERMQQIKGEYPLVVIYHNTFGEHTPDELRVNGDNRLNLLEELVHTTDTTVIVHEPCRGFEDQPHVHYWRQGVPAARHPMQWDHADPTGPNHMARPILGTIGFNLPWKNLDRVAQVSAACGWGCVILSADATEADETRWTALNPHSQIIRGFQPVVTTVEYLSGCDATIFAYEGAGAGTSGAIRLGLAARKPVIAWENRQFRDLQPDGGYIDWCPTFESLPWTLANLPIQRVDPRIVRIAERDSWVHLGEKYAELFRKVVSR